MFWAKMKNVNTTINIYEYNNNMSSPSNARHRRMVALRGIRPCVYSNHHLLEMQNDEGRDLDDCNHVNLQPLSKG